MCGIVGLYNYDCENIIDFEFDLFVDSLKHRGPDGRGVYKDKDVFFLLGHRRLSILDLSSAATQPMPYLNGRFWISFNGEIYNFLELREELKKLGFSFKTDSDTEVILAAYLKWQDECQLKFNGMWAFAIWDAMKKELFLSRDRFGVKPLYYYFDNKRLSFASELKSFWHLKDLDIDFDSQIVANTLDLPCSLEATEITLLKGVKRLQGGHSAFFSKEKGLKIKQWWNTLDHLQVPKENEKEQIEKFKELFLDACYLRMRSDVPIASALSGGLDSSSVLCAITKIRNEKKINENRLATDWQKVFTALYPNTLQDEFKYAKEVIEHTKTTANFCEINAEKMINDIDQILYGCEEIFDLPVGPWLLYKEYRKQGCVISLDGHGGDELLGGYHHQVMMMMQNVLYNQKNIFKFNKLKSVLKRLYVSEKGFNDYYQNNFSLMKMAKGFVGVYPQLYNKLKLIYRKLKGLSGNVGHEWLLLKSDFSTSYDHKIKLNNDFNQLDDLTKILYTDFHFDILPTILRNFDRCSMAHGVEIRAPLLDYRIVTYAFSLKQNMKVSEGLTKLILRKAMEGILPEAIRTRTSKIGFANPLTEWIGFRLKEFILDNISSQGFLESTIWKGAKIKAFVENKYKRNEFNQIESCWKYILAHRLMTVFQNRHVKIKSRINV
ncbi:MAG: asparagine synthase (glutamine-hydrolyzing) [Chlamydiae bacterium]|nr:asparagine synthase (glutamine-hydrolyzing) [Chlamydiota bacterium]